MKRFIQGGIIGLLNGFFGSGGGVIAVPLLERDCPPNQAHASSVALIFTLSLITAMLYGLSGNLDFAAAWDYIPWGIIGAVSGSIFLKKIKPQRLKRLFGGVVTVAALRMLFS